MSMVFADVTSDLMISDDMLSDDILVPIKNGGTSTDYIKNPIGHLETQILCIVTKGTYSELLLSFI